MYDAYNVIKCHRGLYFRTLPNTRETAINTATCRFMIEEAPVSGGKYTTENG